jgi:Na+/proline symporter
MTNSWRIFTGIAILPAYFIATILIGWLAHRRSDSSNAFLNASRSLPRP